MIIITLRQQRITINFGTRFRQPECQPGTLEAGIPGSTQPACHETKRPLLPDRPWRSSCLHKRVQQLPIPVGIHALLKVIVFIDLKLAIPHQRQHRLLLEDQIIPIVHIFEKLLATNKKPA